MDPTVVAAWIAAGVSVLTLVGTLTAQYFGRRGTSKDTEKAFGEQREQLRLTLGEQRTRTFNERFATAAEQLGSDKPPEVRLAGVYAMAGLADDWEENRQTCVDVLCAYLRMPYEPEAEDATRPRRLAFQANREVRHTVIRVITAHLKEDAAVSWQGLNLDFTGVVFDGGDFFGARFSGGTVSFSFARFSGGTVSFSFARFSGGAVFFNDAEFFGGTVDFSFARFSGGMVDFSFARFSGGTVDFNNAEFSRAPVFFRAARFSGGTVDFRAARFSDGPVNFNDAEFSGGTVDFNDAEFSGGEVYFNAKFSGGTVNFSYAEFSGGTVNFRSPRDWSVPPRFPWADTPPPSVILPKKKDQPEV